MALMASAFALQNTMDYGSNVKEIILPGAPKATSELQKVFLPPMQRMQVFVFIFDNMVALYFVYMMPIWDSIKNKFPFFAYDYKIVDKPDCANFVLAAMMQCMSKVSREPGEDNLI